MAHGTVVAVEIARRLFVLQVADGHQLVFSQHSGRTVEIGDLLTGYLHANGFRVFAHGSGFCRALHEAGPLATSDAVQAATDHPASAPIPTTKGRHVDRSVFP